METFADVLHALIDKSLSGDDAEKAHTIIDTGGDGTAGGGGGGSGGGVVIVVAKTIVGTASGTRSEAAAAEAAPAEEAPAEPTTAADEAPEEAPPTPGG